MGVFATRHIPKGTIVVVRDRFDLCLSQEEFGRMPEAVKSTMETYLYHDRCGNLVLSWDHARYMNHNCCCSTMMTDYNIEIAVRDIAAGEELTTEYGLLNIQEPYDIHCGCECCRQSLRLDDIDCHGEEWDARIRESLLLIDSVEQPLWDVLEASDKQRLEGFLAGRETYSSIMNLKWRTCSGQI